MRLNKTEIYNILLQNGLESKEHGADTMLLYMQNNKIIDGGPDEYGDYEVNRLSFNELLGDISSPDEDCELDR